MYAMLISEKKDGWRVSMFEPQMVTDSRRFFHMIFKM